MPAQRETVQQPTKLARRDRNRLPGVLGPLERAPLEPAVKEPEAIMLPVQHFELIALTVAKDK